MIDRIEIEDYAQKPDSCAQKKPQNTAFIVNAEFFFGKEQKEKNNDRSEEIAEKYFLHEREIARRIDEKIHQRKHERRAENKENAEYFFSDLFFHTKHYMLFVKKSQTKRRSLTESAP